jgi:hypothetical protein
MILGHIFGLPINFPLKMLIGISSETGQFIQLFSGFGNLPAKIKGKFSSS